MILMIEFFLLHISIGVTSWHFVPGFAGPFSSSEAIKHRHIHYEDQGKYDIVDFCHFPRTHMKCLSYYIIGHICKDGSHDEKPKHQKLKNMNSNSSQTNQEGSLEDHFEVESILDLLFGGNEWKISIE